MLPLLASSEGEIIVELAFGTTDEHSQRCLQGTVSASVHMVCQRCLEPCPQRLEAEIKLAMLWNDDQAAQLPKSWDPWVVGEGQIDLYPVLEDELILSLPIVAYHNYQCVENEFYESGADPMATKGAAIEPNPFQVLEQLKSAIKEPPDTKD